MALWCGLVLAPGIAGNASEPPRSAWIRGRVLAHGVPLAGATAELVPVESEASAGRRWLEGTERPVVARAQTDQAGIFVLRARSSGPFEVRIAAAGRGSRACLPAPSAAPIDLPPVDLPEAAAEVVEIRPPEGTQVAPTFVDVRTTAPSSRPAPAAATCWGRAPRSGWSDVSGRFLLVREIGEEVRLIATNRWGREEVKLSRTPGDAEVRHWPWSDVRELDVVVVRPSGEAITGAPVWSVGMPVAVTGDGGGARIWVPFAAGDSSGAVRPLDGPVVRAVAADGWSGSWTRDDLTREPAGVLRQKSSGTRLRVSGMRQRRAARPLGDRSLVVLDERRLHRAWRRKRALRVAGAPTERLR